MKLRSVNDPLSRRLPSLFARFPFFRKRTFVQGTNLVDCLFRNLKESYLEKSVCAALPESVLKRDPVALEMKEIQNHLEGQSILVTGAGGSIGRELCLQLIRYRPSVLVLLDNAESSLYEIDYELRYNTPADILPLHIAPVIADIRNISLMQKILYEHDIKIIFHCAAYKHVPLMEFNIEEAIQNNLCATVNLAKAARDEGVEHFVMVSTDKAVNPSCIMGATKRISELYIQNLSQCCDTRFITVRFGNVIGSQGSVVPLFAKQISRGGPVTITHPDMLRYFMTVSEAAGLIIQSVTLGNGSEIFILDMGEPVKIKDLAEYMIRFAGLVPHKDIEIQYIGLRPGEKLFEELVGTGEEEIRPTRHQKIHMATGKNINVNLSLLEKQVEELANLNFQNNRSLIDAALARIIPEYRPAYYSPKKRQKNYPSPAPLQNF